MFTGSVPKINWIHSSVLTGHRLVTTWSVTYPCCAYALHTSNVHTVKMVRSLASIKCKLAGKRHKVSQQSRQRKLAKSVGEASTSTAGGDRASQTQSTEMCQRRYRLLVTAKYRRHRERDRVTQRRMRVGNTAETITTWRRKHQVVRSQPVPGV